MTAWINGILGILATVGIGVWALDLAPLEAFRCSLVSIASGFFAVTTVTRGEQVPFLKKRLFCNIYRMWAVFVSLYFSPMILLSPPIQNLRGFLWLAIPLIMSTGFSILIYGPIQDRLVRGAQRRERAFSRRKAELCCRSNSTSI